MKEAAINTNRGHWRRRALALLTPLVFPALAAAQQSTGCSETCAANGMSGGGMMAMMFLGALVLIATTATISVFLIRRSRPTATR